MVYLVCLVFMDLQLNIQNDFLRNPKEYQKTMGSAPPSPPSSCDFSAHAEVVEAKNRFGQQPVNGCPLVFVLRF